MTKKKGNRRITDGVTAAPPVNQFKIIMAMSMAEFKAWLEGFSECFKNGSPNKAQWKRVEERLQLVTTDTQIVYRDRPTWWPYTYNYTIGSPLIGRGSASPSIDMSPVITCNAANANVSNTIMAATAIGQEEAKEFTV